MKKAKLRMVLPTAGVVALLATPSAFAQDAVEDQPPPPTVQAQTQVGMGLPGATPQATVAAPAAGGTDHALVVGHLGVGYLGRPGVPVGLAGVVVDAPVIGVRYWFDQSMGLDVGLGLGITGGSSDAGGDPPSYWGVVLHGGVPLALASGRHYTFEIIPEANVGLGGGSSDDGDTSHKGFMLDLGARAGAEIQFGFIGLPELALQGSIGAMFSLANQSSGPDDGDSVGASQIGFNTRVYNSPWAVFTNSVSALYYF